MGNVVAMPKGRKGIQDLIGELVGDGSITGIVIVSMHGPDDWRIKGADLKGSELAYAAAMVEFEVMKLLAED